MALPSKAVSSFSLGQRLWNSLSSWTIKASGYQKMGLLREDLYNEDDADVREAIRRLPEKEQQLRLFRLKRATDLSMKHSLLPREQWTTPQQDVPYLMPYIMQVRAELEERRAWEKQ